MNKNYYYIYIYYIIYYIIMLLNQPTADKVNFPKNIFPEKLIFFVVLLKYFIKF